MYEYWGRVEKVVDGDTLDINFDLGFNVHFKARVRIVNIATPEIFRPSCPEEKMHGLAAKHFVESMVLGKRVKVITKKDKTGKYGRYLADIKFPDGITLSDMLRENGFEKKPSY